MAVTCGANCARAFPVYPTECDVNIKQGGISRFVLVTCDWVPPANITDYNDEAVWLAFIEECKIRMTGEVVAQQPAASFTTTVYSSCKPAKVTGSSKTITFRDLNNDEDFITYDFWNELQEYPERYKLGWFDCNGRLYGFYSMSLQVSNVIAEQAQTGTNHFEGTFTYEMKRMATPMTQPVFSSGNTLYDLLLNNMTWNCIDEDPPAYGVPVEVYTPSDFED